MYSRNTSGKTDAQHGEFKSYAEKLPPGYTGSRFSRIKESGTGASGDLSMRERPGMQSAARTAGRFDSGERSSTIRKYEESLPTYSTDKGAKYERNGIGGSDSFMRAQRELEDRAYERAVISEELLRNREEADDINCDDTLLADSRCEECDMRDECENANDKCGDKPSSNVLQSLGDLFNSDVGREDMLLCALLLLLLTESHEDCGDIVMILALLLALR